MALSGFNFNNPQAPQFDGIQSFLKSPQALALAAGLLQAGAPSNNPASGSFGGALGVGLQNMDQANNQAINNQYKSAMAQNAMAQSEMEKQKLGMEMRKQEVFNGLLSGFFPMNGKPNAQPNSPQAGGLLGNIDEPTKQRAGLLFAMGDPKGAMDILSPSATNLEKNLKLAGYTPGTPEFQQAAQAAITKNGVTVNVGDGSTYKIPTGFMLADPKDPSKGVTPIPGSDQDALTPEQASKTEMLRSAKNQIPAIKSLIFNKDGTINQGNILASMNIAGIQGVPFSNGRTLRSLMEQGIQAITRGETGAAMPESEVENTRTRFMPKPVDSDELKRAKLQMFEEFLNGSLKIIDPSGRFDAERFDRELQTRIGTANEQTPQGQTQSTPLVKRTYNLQAGRFE